MNEVPWDQQPLEQLADTIMVGIASAATHAYRDSGIPMFRNLNIKEIGLDDSEVLYIDPGYELQHRNKRLKAGDVLTVRTGYPGISAVVPSKYEGAQCFTSLITRPKRSRISSEFLCYFINSPLGKQFINSAEAGGAQKNVNVSVLAKMQVPVPPLPEQHRIVDILSCWDQAMGKISRILSTTEAQRRKYLQELMYRTETTTALGEVVELIYGKSPKDIVVDDGKYPIIGTGGVVGRTDSALCNEAAVVVGRKGTIDKPVYVDSPFWAIDTTYFTKPKQQLDSYWLLALFQSLNLRTYNESSGVPSLLRETLYTIQIQVPPFETQRLIGNLFRTIDNEISILKELLTRVGLQKQALMQKLLTGKIRVKV